MSTERKLRSFSLERWLVQGICTKLAEGMKDESWGSKNEVTSRYSDVSDPQILIKIKLLTSELLDVENHKSQMVDV